jgi:hypothetical protein
MNRALLVLLAAAGCGQDFDLGSSRDPLAGAPGPLPRAMSRCAPDDVSLLRAPASCPPPADAGVANVFSRGGIHGVCVVDGGGSAPLGASPSRDAPNCPLGVYLSLERPFSTENVEAAISVRRGDLRQLPQDRASATLLTRAIDVFADRPAFFVRFDPRPARGPVIEVTFDLGPLFSAAGGDPDPGAPANVSALLMDIADDEPVIAAANEPSK